MAKILEALAVIKGKDATGGTFDGVAQKISRIARAANALNRDVQRQMNLAASAASSAERQLSRTQRASAMIGTGAKMAAGAAAAYGGAHAVRALAHETAKVSADRAHEKTRMDVSGMTADEIEEAGKLAGEISRKFPSLSQTEMMHTARNVRSMVGTFEEATHVLEPLARLRVVALGAHPEKADELNEDFDKLAKGMEIKGVTQHRAQFEHYIDNMSKAINVFGDTLRPTDYYEMFKYGRAATNALSDDFMLKTAPTLAQELGGSSAGKAMSGFHTQFVGQIMKHHAAKQMAELGMIDPKKIEYNKVGDVKRLKPGAITVGKEFLQPGKEDPYAWTQAAVAHLRARGKTDEQIQEIFTAIASRETVAQMLNTFFTQKSRIEKDWELVKGAKGGEAAESYQKNDPKVITKSIGAQIDNTLANTTEPMMPAVNQGLNWLTSGLAWAAEHAKEKPGHVAASGAWGAAFLSALGFDSAMSAGGHLLGKGGGSSWLLSKMVGTMAPMLWVSQLASDSVTDEDIKRLKAYEAGPRSRLDKLKELDDAEQAGLIYGDGDPVYTRQLRERVAAQRAELEKELEGFGYNANVTAGRWTDRAGPQWTIDDIRKATGGGQTEPVKAVVEGNATLTTTVTVKPESGFWAQVEQRIEGAINAFRSSGGPATGSTGSTGQSMPEAGPSH